MALSMESEKKPAGNAYDDIEMWRCPQLGGPVTFKYCRVMNEGAPCRRIITCWAHSLDIITYLEANFTVDELQAVFGVPSKDRWTRIVETLKRVRREREG